MSEDSLFLAPAQGARASNLAFGLRCLPRDRREDALVFYDFCRAVDDIADDPFLAPEKKRRLLGLWRTALADGAGLPASLSDLISRRSLDRTLMQKIVHGCTMDIEPHRYANYEELQDYCWHVACAVGLVSADLFGCHDPRSKIYAEHLGHALQLTNILRDVAEDARLGRIYLPTDDLARFGVTETSLLAGKPDGDFTSLMEFEAIRAEGRFSEAEKSLPPADTAALLPARVMQAIYRKILHRMRRDQFRVFEKRYRLSRTEKFLILARVCLFKAS